MTIQANELKINIYSDESVDLEFGADVSKEHEDLMVKSFESKGYSETRDAALENTLVSSKVWVCDSLNKGTDGLPYWHPKVVAEHKAKLRTQERAARSAAAAPKPAKPIDPFTLGDGTGRKYVNIPDLPKTPGVPNKLKKEEDEQEVTKFESNGQWHIEKSGYGPKKSGQYSDADNARRKANNTDQIDSLGNMGRVKNYGPSNPKVIDIQDRRVRRMNRKQPVKTFSQEEIAAMNAEGKYGAGKKVAKSWVEHNPIPSATEVKKPVLKTAEELMPNQLANLLLNKSVIGATQKQPTDQEMFGHLVVTDEQAKAAQEAWETTLSSWHANVSKPVEKQELNKSWGSRGSIENEQFTEEEERIRKIPVSPESY